MDFLTRARRRLALRLSLLGLSVVAPIVGGLVWGVDGFLLGAFGIPAVAICVFAMSGAAGGRPRNWPHSL